MTFYLIIGPPASGKFTIGKDLAQELDINYIHEHNILDIISSFDIQKNYDSIIEYLNLRLYLTNRYLKTSTKDFISTMVVDFNNPLHISFIKKTAQILGVSNSKLIIIELTASQKVRLARNINDDRLFYKPTKQDIEKSTAKILELDKHTSLNSVSLSLEDYAKNIIHIKINNEGSKKTALKNILNAING